MASAAAQGASRNRNGNEEIYSMTVRLSRKKNPEDSPQQIPSQGKQAEGRFRLQVDRQTKAAYDTMEAAETAGMAIKKSYPIVHIGVYDHLEGTSKIIQMPDA
jgi:hypothetical protein